MPKELEKLKKLEYLGMLRIIHLLAQEKQMLTSKIQKNIEISGDAYYKARTKLIDNELIEQKKDKYSAIAPFKLTAKGERIAEFVDKILELL